MSRNSGRFKLAKPHAVTPATPPPTAPARVFELDEDLMEDLEVTCLDAMRGDPPGPGMAKRLERAVGDVLRARGITAVVQATSDRSGTRVVILVPKPDKTVAQVTLTVG
jgi:hypothetical protein